MEMQNDLCLFNFDNGLLSKHFKMEDFKLLGYKCNIVEGTIYDLINKLSELKKRVFFKQKVIIMDSSNIDAERFYNMVNLIYTNYCSNIIALTDAEAKRIEGVRYVDIKDIKSFDLNVSNELLELKKKIESNPLNNVSVVKSKIHEYLCWFKFSPKYTGFQYFVDACCLTFFNYPDKINILKIYDIIGEKHRKTGYAIEKAMRTALSGAIQAIRSLPESPDNSELKDYVKHEIGNLGTVNIIVSKLLVEGDFGSDFYKKD